MRDIVLNPRDLFARIWKTFIASVQRNRTIIKAVFITFFGVMIACVLVTVLAFSVNPGLSDFLKSLLQNESSYIVIPPPYTETLYFYIFLNNIGHFWNPIRLLVWVPLLGVLEMGFELFLNAALIGVLATIVGMTKGATYSVLGLIPHGIFEIPAFILEFTSIIRWHIATIEAIAAKAMGRKVNAVKLERGLKDTLILAVASVILFAIAAVIETYVTPRLLRL